MNTFNKRLNIGQKHHRTNVMARLQQTQREVLLYLPFTELLTVPADF